MDDARLVEDRLRAEYVALLPAMQRTLTGLMTEVNHLLLPAILDLDRYEKILVKGRIKDSESALDSLRRRQRLARFDVQHGEDYSLTTLPDLVGIRVLAFPMRRLEDVRRILETEPRLSTWTSDHIESPNSAQPPVAFKYQGLWNVNDSFRSELQIASLLIGLFWEVEHSAIYKPTPRLQGVAGSISMRDRNDAVLNALQSFEQEFENQLKGGFDPPQE
jgi:ppGpp synthetase/RelA/SpoT-type nucleotidyltranferase